jgi:predicted transposase YdaD
MQPRPDLVEAVLSILGERFPHLTREEIMALINLPTDHLRDTRFGQELLAEGEARGRSAEAVAVALRQLSLAFGPMSEATTSRIQALPLAQPESPAEALLNSAGLDDLAAWLAEQGS